MEWVSLNASKYGIQYVSFTKLRYELTKQIRYELTVLATKFCELKKKQDFFFSISGKQAQKNNGGIGKLKSNYLQRN